MIARLVAITIAMGALCASLVLYDAAATTQTALSLSRAAQAVEAPAQRDALFADAHNRLIRAPSRPLAWHAGALEAASWIEAERGDGAASVQAAAAGVSRAPLQALAWVRLSALRHDLCADGDCLARSWIAAPILAPDAACARLQIAYEADERFAADDPRLQLYAASGPTPEDLAACLAFLPPNERLPLALEAQRRAAALRPR